MIFQFGEDVPGYNIRVINERVARAAAGILFLFAMISFFNALLLGNFYFTKIFVTFFMVDFIIRVLVNPKYSPSMVLGKYFVRYQNPEWVGAPQKKWAWSIGLILSLVMFYIIVVAELMTPIKIFICVVCLALLFSEAVFGICIGCRVYKFAKKNPQYCSGESCTIETKEYISPFETFVLILSLLIVIGYFVYSSNTNKVNNSNTPINKCVSGKCQIGKCGI